MKICRNLPIAVLAGLSLAAAASAQNQILNGGFEDLENDWRAFIPPENIDHHLRFTVVEQGAHSGLRVARLESPDTISRFGVSNLSLIEVAEGERYRLSAWYRAEPGAILADWAPGLVLRATFFGPDKKPAAQNMHVGPGGAVSASPGREIREPSLSEAWTRVSAVITIPKGVTRMHLNLFLWGMQGTLFVDDVMVESVPAK